MYGVIWLQTSVAGVILPFALVQLNHPVAILLSTIKLVSVYNYTVFGLYIIFLNFKFQIFLNYSLSLYLGCVPYSEEACRAAANALGLTYDGAGFTEKGCYAYSTGYVYYNSAGTMDEKKSSIASPMYRPDGHDCKIKRKGI